MKSELDENLYRIAEELLVRRGRFPEEIEDRMNFLRTSEELEALIEVNKRVLSGQAVHPRGKDETNEKNTPKPEEGEECWATYDRLFIEGDKTPRGNLVYELPKSIGGGTILLFPNEVETVERLESKMIHANASERASLEETLENFLERIMHEQGRYVCDYDQFGMPTVSLCSGGPAVPGARRAYREGLCNPSVELYPANNSSFNYGSDDI